MSREMMDQLKKVKEKLRRDALKVAIEKSKYKVQLNSLVRHNFLLSINDQNDFTSLKLAGNAVFVGATWNNKRITEMTVVSENGEERPLAAQNSLNAPTPPRSHPDLHAPIRVSDLSALRLKFSESDKDAFQKITLYFRLETEPNSNLALPADVILPKGHTSATLMNFVVPVVMNELTEHLNLNALYYSQQIWLEADSSMLTMQFADLEYNGKRLIEHMNPTPVSATANYLVFLWNDELDDNWVQWKAANADMGKVDVDLVALPTGGVFAEAVLGRFNSAEKLDITRFWNWQDSPIPVQAPDIAAIQAGQHQIAGVPQIGSLEAPIVSIQNPQPLPDPQGMSAILSALATSNMFRDMSGAAAGALLTQAALQNSSAGASNASNQAGANLANAGQLQVEALKALMPLIMAGAGAALGVPIPPNLGNSSSSNAGALINHGRSMDSRGVGGATPSTGGSVGSGGGGIGGGTSGSGSLSPSNLAGNAGVINATSKGANESAAFANTIPVGIGMRIPGDILHGGLVSFTGSDSTEIPLSPSNGGMSIDDASLQTGDILLSTSNSLVSGAIRLATNSPISHAAIYIGNGEVVEAITDGVVLQSLEEALRDDTVSVAFRYPNLTEAQGLLIKDFVGKNLGTPYNYWGIVKGSPFFIAHSHSRIYRVDLRTRDNSSFFCSQLVIAAYQQAGVPITSEQPNLVTPGDLARMREDQVPEIQFGSQLLQYVGHLKA